MRYRWHCETGKAWDSFTNRVYMSRWFADRRECEDDLAVHKRHVRESVWACVWDSEIESVRRRSMRKMTFNNVAYLSDAEVVHELV